MLSNRWVLVIGSFARMSGSGSAQAEKPGQSRDVAEVTRVLRAIVDSLVAFVVNNHGNEHDFNAVRAAATALGLAAWS